VGAQTELSEWCRVHVPLNCALPLSRSKPSTGTRNNRLLCFALSAESSSTSRWRSTRARPCLTASRTSQSWSWRKTTRCIACLYFTTLYFTADDDVYRVLVLHYNRNNQIEASDWYRNLQKTCAEKICTAQWLQSRTTVYQCSIFFSF